MMMHPWIHITLLLFASLLYISDAFSSARCVRRQTSCSIEQQYEHHASSSKLLAYTKGTTIEGPPLSTKPDYSSIHGPLGSFIDDIFMTLFRTKLAEKIDRLPDSNLPKNDFIGIIELTTGMNVQYNNRTQVQELAQGVLISLFPPFILDKFPTWFAKPFPNFSARMCAWATVVGGTWLMGECEVNDVPELENGGKNQGVLVSRCRFLEESQCASTCVNSCKIPTQNFFRQNMGLALTMTPDYDTGECQFSYGKLSTEEEEKEARETPCLMRCPSSGGMRRWHDGNIESNVNNEQWLDDLNALAKLNEKQHTSGGSICSLMKD